MYTEPSDVDPAVLARRLERHWGLSEPTLAYVPIGFGSHHWCAIDGGGVRHFVSVDDLTAHHHGGADGDTVFDILDRAFRTAAALANEGELEFVVPPVPDGEGRVLRRLDDGHAVRVEPFIDGATAPAGAFETPEERHRMATALGRLHTVTLSIDPPARDDLAIPCRSSLEEALEHLDAP